MPRSSEFVTVTVVALPGVRRTAVSKWGRETKCPEYRQPLNNCRLRQLSDLERLPRGLSKSLKAVGHRWR